MRVHEEELTVGDHAAALPDRQSAADQVAVLFAAGEGYTGTIAVEDVPRYADALLARIHRTYPELHDLVHSGKKLPPEALERLRELAAETLKNL